MWDELRQLWSITELTEFGEAAIQTKEKWSQTGNRVFRVATLSFIQFIKVKTNSLFSFRSSAMSVWARLYLESGYGFPRRLWAGWRSWSALDGRRLSPPQCGLSCLQNATSVSWKYNICQLMHVWVWETTDVAHRVQLRNQVWRRSNSQLINMFLLQMFWFVKVQHVWFLLHHCMKMNIKHFCENLT